MSCGRPAHLGPPVILVLSPLVPVPTGTHGEPQAVHGNTSQLTPCESPLLCAAALQPRLVVRSDQGPARLRRSHSVALAVRSGDAVPSGCARSTGRHTNPSADDRRWLTTAATTTGHLLIAGFLLPYTRDGSDEEIKIGLCPGHRSQAFPGRTAGFGTVVTQSVTQRIRG